MANQNPQPNTQLAMTVDQFCKACGISKPMLYRLWQQGQGPRSVKLGKRRLILKNDADAWLATLPQANEAIH